jgi:imidazolonepropionase-like amidohydrolase
VVSRDELAAAIDAAHQRGARVRGHIANKEALGMALNLGIDTVDHGDAMAAVLPEANVAGMRLELGDDFGAINFPHDPYADELAHYVEVVGIPALEVLTWVTRNGAEVLTTSALSRPASSPTCWWWTATRWSISMCCATPTHYWPCC